jgi:hypothetical protein
MAVWQPTNWAEIDDLNYLQLLFAVVDGRAFTSPDRDNPGCVVLRYSSEDPEDEDDSCDFVDEWNWLNRDGLVTWDTERRPVATAEGVEYARAERFKLEILVAISQGRCHPTDRRDVYRYDPADGDKFDGSAFTLDGLTGDDLVYLDGRRDGWHPYLTSDGERRLELFDMAIAGRVR